MVSYSPAMLYVEVAEESFEMTFQALEIVNNAYVEVFPMQPSFLDASLMMA